MWYTKLNCFNVKIWSLTPGKVASPASGSVRLKADLESEEKVTGILKMPISSFT